MQYLKTFEQFVNEDLFATLETYTDFLQSENLAPGFEEGERELAYEDKDALEELGVNESYYWIRWGNNEEENNDVADFLVQKIVNDEVESVRRTEGTSENINVEKYRFSNIEFVVLDHVSDTHELSQLDIFIHPNNYSELVEYTNVD